MTYNYNGKTITIDDELARKYEEMNGSAITDLDIMCAIQSSDINIATASAEILSKAVTDSMTAETAIWDH